MGRAGFRTAAAVACALLTGAAFGSADAQPPEDSLVSLGRDASAVFDVGVDASLQLTETSHGVTATRTLKVGDDYRDGWEITAISDRSVSLRKADQTRTVILTGLPQVPISTAPPPVSVPIAATNALSGGGKGQSKTAALAGAIAALRDGGGLPGAQWDPAAHDAAVAAVLANGGTAQDLAGAEMSRADFPDLSPLDATSARLVRTQDGMAAISMIEIATGQPRLLFLGTNVIPPGGVDSLPPAPSAGK